MPVTAEQLVECDRLDRDRIRHTIARTSGARGDDIDDAYQDAMLAAWSRRGTFRRGREVRPWLTAIAVNKGRDLGRKAYRRREMPVEEFFDQPMAAFDPLEPSIRAELSDQVTSVLLQCSPSHREVLTLVYIDGMKYQEAADLLKIPIGTVKSRIYQAKREFRGKWRNAT